MRLLALLLFTIISTSLLATGTRKSNGAVLKPRARGRAPATLHVLETAGVILGRCKIVVDPRVLSRYTPLECSESGGTCVFDPDTGRCIQHILRNGEPVRLSWSVKTEGGDVKCRGLICRPTMPHELHTKESAKGLGSQPGRGEARGGAGRAGSAPGTGLIDVDFAQVLLGAEQPSQSSSNVN